MDHAFWIELVLVVLLLGLSGFFSSSEISLFSLNSTQIEKMRAEQNPRIGLIERLLSEPRRLIVTILIGNEFVNVAASAISAAMVIQVFEAENKIFNLFHHGPHPARVRRDHPEDPRHSQQRRVCDRPERPDRNLSPA